MAAETSREHTTDILSALRLIIVNDCLFTHPAASLFTWLLTHGTWFSRWGNTGSCHRDNTIYTLQIILIKPLKSFIWDFINAMFPCHPSLCWDVRAQCPPPVCHTLWIGTVTSWSNSYQQYPLMSQGEKQRNPQSHEKWWRKQRVASHTWMATGVVGRSTHMNKCVHTCTHTHTGWPGLSWQIASRVLDRK